MNEESGLQIIWPPQFNPPLQQLFITHGTKRQKMDKGCVFSSVCFNY